jgi:UDPglucose 6-dehydrogenase
MKTNVGIIGQGFVGTALKEGLKNKFNVETYDNAKESTCSSIQELCERTKIIFICVPTPMRQSGACDTTIVESVVNEIEHYANKHISVIKSTIPPGTTERLNKECINSQVVFNPEFLTEANFIDDFKNQARIIIGGPRPGSTHIKNLYRKAFPNTPLIKTGSTTAEMVKYFTNCFLATKVSFSNEFKQMCEKVGVDYDKIVEYGLYDDRLGKSHFSSPGPDGKDGFGGSCFPKDLNALIKFAENIDVKPMVLKAVWHKNLEVRPEKDWEQLKGRAVSEENNG